MSPKVREPERKPKAKPKDNLGTISHLRGTVGGALFRRRVLTGRNTARVVHAPAAAVGAAVTGNLSAAPLEIRLCWGLCWDWLRLPPAGVGVAREEARDGCEHGGVADKSGRWRHRVHDVVRLALLRLPRVDRRRVVAPRVVVEHGERGATAGCRPRRLGADRLIGVVDGVRVHGAVRAARIGDVRAELPLGLLLGRAVHEVDQHAAQVVDEAGVERGRHGRRVERGRGDAVAARGRLRIPVARVAFLAARRAEDADVVLVADLVDAALVVLLARHNGLDADALAGAVAALRAPGAWLRQIAGLLVVAVEVLDARVGRARRHVPRLGFLLGGRGERGREEKEQAEPGNHATTT